MWEVPRGELSRCSEEGEPVWDPALEEQHNDKTPNIPPPNRRKQPRSDVSVPQPQQQKAAWVGLFLTQAEWESLRQHQGSPQAGDNPTGGPGSESLSILAQGSSPPRIYICPPGLRKSSPALNQHKEAIVRPSQHQVHQTDQNITIKALKRSSPRNHDPQK